MRMVDAANHDRPDAGGIKVGGHQASSASMVGIMTSLWFNLLEADGKVAVKPHASPVYHAIRYLIGEIDKSWLLKFRSFGGLQAYPSRTKDPDVADFSTGSVGHGAVAPLFAAATRRYLASHFKLGAPGWFIALIGDAELDEGNVWEAIGDPALQKLHNVWWVVDLNRQSLDRVVPELKVRRLEQLFAACGWNVVEAKWGRRIEALFASTDGEVLRKRLEDMSNEEYQSIVAGPRSEVGAGLLAGADAALKRLIAGGRPPRCRTAGEGFAIARAALRCLRAHQPAAGALRRPWCLPSLPDPRAGGALRRLWRAAPRHISWP